MSKRAATTTPCASPSQAAPKRSRTHYSYGEDDDAEAESFSEDQWSAGDSDSMMLDSEDDDVDESMPQRCGDFSSASTCSDEDGAQLVRYGLLCCPNDLQVTGIPRRAPTPPPAASTRCTCRASSAKGPKACAHCACSEWGHACQPATCGCRGGAGCHNPFNKVDLASVFGPAPVTLHACFITWVRTQTAVAPEHMTARSLCDRALQSHDGGGGGGCTTRARAPCRDDDDDNADPPSRPKGDDALPERARQQEVNRLAFTSSQGRAPPQQQQQQQQQQQPAPPPPPRPFFSLCAPAGGWEDGEETWHCRLCGECVHRTAWHCGACNRCSYGTSLPCEGCGGVSADYHQFAKLSAGSVGGSPTTRRPDVLGRVVERGAR